MVLTAQIDGMKIDSLQAAEFYLNDILERNKALDALEITVEIERRIVVDIMNRLKKPVYEQYTKELDAFFEGKLRKMLFPDTDDQEYYSGHSKTKGHVWICEHGNFDTLTVEPIEGGQYEIAVRFTNEESQDTLHKYPGYALCDGIGCLIGFGTGGH